MYFGLGMPFLGTAIGACAALGVPLGSLRWNAALSGGAAGAMTAACIWNLLLPALAGDRAMALAGFMVGFLGLLLPERLPGLRLSPAGALLLAVVLHNIPEGLAVGAGDSAGLTLGTAPSGMWAGQSLSGRSPQRRGGAAGRRADAPVRAAADALDARPPGLRRRGDAVRCHVGARAPAGGQRLGRGVLCRGVCADGRMRKIKNANRFVAAS